MDSKLSLARWRKRWNQNTNSSEGKRMRKMRKEKNSLMRKAEINGWKILVIYFAILAFAAAFWIGVIILIVNILKWFWGA